MAIASVKATINGVTYDLTYNQTSGKYESTITAPTSSSYPLDGHYYPISITATDDAGNTTTVDDTDSSLGSSLQLVVKESVVPVIAISSPTSGELTSNNAPTIAFTVADDDSGVDSGTIILSIDGTAVSNSALTITEIDGGYSVSYTPTTALEDGEHTVTVNASDNDGNAATAVSVTFNVLAAAPSLAITSPTDGIYTNNGTITISGTTDGESVVIQVGTGAAINATITGGAYSETVTLSEGANTITVTATSAAGVTTTITRTVYLDTKAPVFISISATPNPVGVGNTYIISVEVEDE